MRENLRQELAEEEQDNAGVRNIDAEIFTARVGNGL